ncbi:hypothetical protein CPB86DRAFT_717388 [Serendipita vermifera]|nr:hypothetical protein CPB86DRAFT_717388 [Serendipita vermifera]
MPATEPIKLSIIVPPPFLSYALEGWERLETINIFCYNAIADVNTPPKDIPTTVKRFSLFGLKNVPFIIFSSSAEAFCCRTDSSSPSANVHKPVLNPTQWSALRTLDIHGDIFSWKNSSVLHLKTIILRKRSGFGDVDNGVTSFVHAVACHSDYYPSLEEIVLEECPEWDILMIMLERRNLLASPPIKPIKKITLPSICPPNIRRIIIDILKGKWPQRPSNKDLSPTSCVKSILDLTLPGCYTCHRTPRTCDEPIKVFWKGAPDYRPESLLGLVEKYPHNEEEILNTWRERALVWEQFNQDRGPRKINCVLRRQYSSLKSLDANSY